MSLGEKFANLAVSKITNGQMWTHDATFIYGVRRDAANPWDEASDLTPIDPQTVRVGAFPVERALKDGGVKVAQWEIYVPAESIDVRPTVEDTVTIDGVRCEIVSSTSLSANGVSAVYKIMALR